MLSPSKIRRFSNKSSTSTVEESFLIYALPLYRYGVLNPFLTNKLIVLLLFIFKEKSGFGLIQSFI